MAEQAKKMRSHALSLFTRAEKSCNRLITANSPLEVVATQYQKVLQNWDKLEAAHESFISITDIDIDGDNLGLKYIEEPSTRYDAVLDNYSNYCKETRETEKTNADQIDIARRKAEEEERKKVEAERQAAETARLEEEITRNFESKKKEFLFSLESFDRWHATLDESMKVASDSDKRSELTRFTEEFSSLREKLKQT